MKIGFFELEDWEEKIIRENFPNDEVFLSKEKITELNLPAQNDFEIVSIFVNSEINEKALAHFPNLKFVTTRSTGYDHIDLEACKKRGVQAAFVPGYGNNTVAEWAFGLILNLTRKMYLAIDRIKETEEFNFDGLRGVDLKNRTIGIIG
ncbi:MAG: hydroxyacid dehydrogenase, partial [Patescibacteria group bacterium]